MKFAHIFHCKNILKNNIVVCQCRCECKCHRHRYPYLHHSRYMFIFVLNQPVGCNRFTNWRFSIKQSTVPDADTHKTYYPHDFTAQSVLYWINSAGGLLFLSCSALKPAAGCRNTCVAQLEPQKLYLSCRAIHWILFFPLFFGFLYQFCDTLFVSNLKSV